MYIGSNLFEMFEGNWLFVDKVSIKVFCVVDK